MTQDTTYDKTETGSFLGAFQVLLGAFQVLLTGFQVLSWCFPGAFLVLSRCF